MLPASAPSTRRTSIQKYDRTTLVPAGCSMQSGGGNPDWAAHYNIAATSTNDGRFTPVCKSECVSGSGAVERTDLSAYKYDELHELIKGKGYTLKPSEEL
mmetsp:Transcript_78130/g.137652  ORF Transcript_78130/g.137652 Transcript_78130/m.137652 type:complete len:100 (+) Transcript_78130:408-707(+)